MVMPSQTVTISKIKLILWADNSVQWNFTFSCLIRRGGNTPYPLPVSANESSGFDRSLLVTLSQLNLYARSKLELYLTVMREMQFLVRRASTNCYRHVFAHAMYACGVFVPLLHYPRASERATGAFPLPCQTGTAVLRSAVQHNKNTVSRYANTSRRTTQHETPHGPRPLSTSFQWRRTQ